MSLLKQQNLIDIIHLKTGKTSYSDGFFFILNNIEGNLIPITDHNKLVAFHNLSDASGILQAKGFEPQTFDTDDIFVCDVFETLHLIKYGNNDDNAVIINLLNVLSDVLIATNVHVTERYRALLIAFADHLTFSKNLDEYFTNNNILRVEILDGVIWCMGALLCAMTFSID